MATPGYIWIDGAYLHYIDALGGDRSLHGIWVATTGTPGHIWLESGGYLHYIDGNGDRRYYIMTQETGIPAESGHFWITANRLYATRDNYIYFAEGT